MSKKKSRREQIEERIERKVRLVRQPDYMPIRVRTPLGHKLRELTEAMDRSWERFAMATGLPGGPTMEQMIEAQRILNQFLLLMNNIAGSLSKAGKYKYFKPPRGMPEPQMIPEIVGAEATAAAGGGNGQDAVVPPAPQAEQPVS